LIVLPCRKSYLQASDSDAALMLGFQWFWLHVIVGVTSPGNEGAMTQID
jgi:hypothetical protein